MLRNGHAPGHVRQTFTEAIEAFDNWKPGEPEPKVEYEVNYEPREVSISEACGLVWNCTDILPGLSVQQLQDAGLVLKGRTYAAAAHAMLASIKERTSKVA